MRYSNKRLTALSLAVAGALVLVGGCVEPTGPLGAPNVIQVKTTAAAVTITLAQSNLRPGQNTQASVVAVSRDGQPVTAPIDFRSQNPSVATVSSRGVVTAVSAGAAVIQATVAGCTGVAALTVAALVSPIAQVTVALDSPNLAIGHVARATAVAKDSAGDPVTAPSASWTSSAVNVATVSSTGAVTAVGAGSTNIRATISGVSGSAALVVVQSPPLVSTVNVTIDSATLTVGHSALASATARDGSGNTITGQTARWSSLSPSVATVSSSGVVTAVAAGPATIQAEVSGTVGTVALAVVTPPTLASWDFNDGTIGPYYTNPYAGQVPGNLDFPDDPTGSGRGKVARFEYVHVTSPDKNRALNYSHLVHLGETMFFRGEFYLPIPNVNLPAGAGRKLIYWQPNSDPTKYGGDGGPLMHFVLGTNGDDKLWYLMSYTGQDGSDHRITGSTGQSLLPNTWYTLEAQMTLETSVGAGDASVRVWLNGVLVYSNLAFQWTDPAWIGQPRPGGNGTPFDVNDLAFRDFLVGQQMNYDGAYDEYRYWDNVSFSSTRIGH